jgi:hypothetical protein
MGLAAVVAPAAAALFYYVRESSRDAQKAGLAMSAPPSVKPLMLLADAAG